MGSVHALRTDTGTRLADAVKTFLDTPAIKKSPNTHRSYSITLNRMVTDLGADTSTTGLDPDRVADWFNRVWADKSPKTYNVRLSALKSAYRYWEHQGWTTVDPTVRLAARPEPADRSRALTHDQMDTLLAVKAPLRERVLWNLLYESACRAEEALMLNITDLDTANRRAVVIRKGGARDVIHWQTGTARLLPRLLNGRRSGPVFLTDRKARPSVALADVDPTTECARLSYRRAAELFEAHTADLPGGPWTLHQLRHTALTHAAEDGANTPLLMAMSGHTSIRSLAKYARPSAEAVGRWRAEVDPARRGAR